MKISELIEELGVLQGVHGDVEVHIAPRIGQGVRGVKLSEMFVKHGRVYVTNMVDDEIQQLLDAS